jgi:hypothetical protein
MGKKEILKILSVWSTLELCEAAERGGVWSSVEQCGGVAYSDVERCGTE